MRRPHLALMNLFLAGTMLTSLGAPWPAAAQAPDQMERQRERPGDQGPRQREQRGPEQRGPDQRMERPQNGGGRAPQQERERAPRPEREQAPRPEREQAPRPERGQAPRPERGPSSEPRAPGAPRPAERAAPQDRAAPQEQRQQRQQEREQRQQQRQQDRQQRQDQRQNQGQGRPPRDAEPGQRRQPPSDPALQNGGPRELPPGTDRRPRDRDAAPRDDQRPDRARPGAGGPGVRDDNGRDNLRDNGPRDNDRRDTDRRDTDRRDTDRRDLRGAGPGAGPGFLPPTDARRLDDIRRDRRQVREGDRTLIREPGRTIIEDHGRSFIVHDETARYRALGLDVRRERRGNAFIETIARPNGDQILVYTDVTGRLLRRIRRTRDGREFVLIDNGDPGRIRRYEDDVVVLPPPPIGIPRDRYILDYDDANPNLIYDTLIAPPVAPPPRRYTLDQIRYSPDVRNYVRSVDINTINFDTGSWDVPAEATGKLRALADAIKRALDRDPNAVFMVEGYTDAVGNADDNLSLSDRRAQSVAEILTKSFGVAPENLVTQGYGEQNLREATQGPSAVNRRVVVRNITALLATGPAPDNR